MIKRKSFRSETSPENFHHFRDTTILEAFKDEARTILCDAEAALAVAAAEAFWRSIHNLKGAASNLGLIDCVTLCVEAESESSPTGECLSDLLSQLQRTVSEEIQSQASRLPQIAQGRLALA